MTKIKNVLLDSNTRIFTVIDGEIRPMRLIDYKDSLKFYDERLGIWPKWQKSSAPKESKLLTVWEVKRRGKFLNHDNQTTFYYDCLMIPECYNVPKFFYSENDAKNFLYN